jgi:hypothetical protein
MKHNASAPIIQNGANATLIGHEILPQARAQQHGIVFDIGADTAQDEEFM